MNEITDKLAYQNIRDDILEMNNLTPSYTRQGMKISATSGGSDGGYEE